MLCSSPTTIVRQRKDSSSFALLYFDIDRHCCCCCRCGCYPLLLLMLMMLTLLLVMPMLPCIGGILSYSRIVGEQGSRF